MLGYDVDTRELGVLAGKLATGAGGIEAMAAPPPAPDAGIMTGLIAAHLAAITGAIASLSENLTEAQTAVSGSADSYERFDTDAAGTYGSKGDR
jgi:hypothetical protein